MLMTLAFVAATLGTAIGQEERVHGHQRHVLAEETSTDVGLCAAMSPPRLRSGSRVRLLANPAVGASALANTTQPTAAEAPFITCDYPTCGSGSAVDGDGLMRMLDQMRPSDAFECITAVQRFHHAARGTAVSRSRTAHGDTVRGGAHAHGNQHHARFAEDSHGSVAEIVVACRRTMEVLTYLGDVLRCPDTDVDDSARPWAAEDTRQDHKQQHGTTVPDQQLRCMLRASGQMVHLIAMISTKLQDARAALDTIGNTTLQQRCRVAIAMSKAATQDGAGARASSEAGAYSVQAGKKYRADPCCNLCSANNAFDAAAVDVCVRMENVEDRFNQLLGGECG